MQILVRKGTIRTVLIGLFYWLSAGASPTSHAGEAPVERVSIIQLISSPDRFDGRIVNLVGVLRLEFEESAVYLGPDDARHKNRKNGIWVEMTEEQESMGRRLNGRYVVIEGRFDKGLRGHLGLWSGSLIPVTKVAEWEPKRTSEKR